MNLKTRAEMVRAMETIARCINNEDIFWNIWASCGVADGDITKDTTDEDLEWYCSDTEYKELMTLFLKCMFKAAQSGGLYSDGIVSGERVIEWK